MTVAPRTRRASRRWVALAVSGWLAVAGCGARPGSGTLYPVKGQVLLADGKPLSAGSVHFIPSRGGLTASGVIGTDGTFSLRSKGRSGAAPGEYKVRIEPKPELLARKGTAAPKLPFAARYREYDGETGLSSPGPGWPSPPPAIPRTAMLS